MTTWTAPRTWADNDLVSADDLNEQLRDNLTVLKDPPTDHYECDEDSDYTTTSTSFVDIDSDELALTVTTTGGDVMVQWVGSLKGSAGLRVYFDIDLDDARVGGDDGLCVCGLHTDATSIAGLQTISFTWLITGVSAGAHTIKLQWKVSAGTATLYAGAGTANYDVHPQFWVREVS